MPIHQKLPTMSLSFITMRVGSGSSTPRPTNRLAKIGTTNFSSPATMSTAMLITEQG